MFPDLLYRLRAIFRRNRMEAELDEEVRFHFENQVEANRREGMSRREARRRARLSFGGVEEVKEECRDARGVSFLETTFLDLRYAVRSLCQKPGFTAVVVVSLALGIGANTAVFSVVNAILLRPLPYEDPERIVLINSRWYQPPASAAEYQAWEEENPVFERMAYWGGGRTGVTLTVKNDGGAQNIEGRRVSASLFSLLGVQPILGRNFLPDEEVASAVPTVILSYRLWERLFEKDPNAIGKNLRINRENATVVGVMPQGFVFADVKEQIWVVARADFRLSSRGMPVMARLKPGVSIGQAQVVMETLAARRAEQYPETDADWRVTVVPLHDARWSGARLRERLFIFSCAVGFVLLIACANVAGLLLVRSSSRRKEMATRLALGAGRWRLVRQLLTESTLLAVAGGALGVAVAYGGLKVLLAFSPDNHQFDDGRFFPRMNEAGIDGDVLGYALLISLLTGLVAGIAPAFKGSKHNLSEASRGTTPDSGQQRSSSLLVVAQVALALVLLIGAGSMINSFVRLQSVDVGFNPDDVLTFRVDLRQGEYANSLGSPDESGKYSGDLQVINFYRQVLERVRAVPGVESAAAIGFLPLSHYTFNSHVGVDGRPPKDRGERGRWDPEARVRHKVVMGDLFQTLGIPLLRGRDFTAQDSAEAPGVVVISEGMARRHWPDQDPIGRQLTLRSRRRGAAGRPLEVVGVVGDIQDWSLQQEPWAAVYVPRVQQQGMNSGRLLRMSFAVRTASEATALIPAVRAAVAGVDPEVPIYAVAPMDRFYLIWTGESRFYTLLLGVFAGLALILSAIGVYGVMAHSVTRRTHEIGIRMALGAQSSEVLKAVMRWGVALTMIGVALGLAAAFILTRLTGAFGLMPAESIESSGNDNVLYGITPTDPATFVAVAIVMTAVALLACYIPARRATKVEPMIALRHE